MLHVILETSFSFKKIWQAVKILKKPNVVKRTSINIKNRIKKNFQVLSINATKHNIA